MSNARHGLQAQVRPVDDAEAETLRAATDTVIVAKTTHRNATKLHLPTDDGLPLCQGHTTAYGTDSKWAAKDLAVYPPGWADWCQYCAALYRRGVYDGDD